LKGVSVTIVYGFAVSFVILKIIDMTLGLRVTEEQERQGLDISLHGESLE
jgi:Amt family ammonium transporter